MQILEPRHRFLNLFSKKGHRTHESGPERLNLLCRHQRELFGMSRLPKASPSGHLRAPLCSDRRPTPVMNEAPGGSVARRTAPMLSHSTFSGSAHLGGPSTRGPSSITLGSGGRHRSDKTLFGAVAHQWEVVEKPCECHMGKQATVKRAERPKKVVFLSNEVQNQLKRPFVMIK